MVSVRKRVTDYLIEDHLRLHRLIERAAGAGRFDEAAFVELRGGLLRHIAIEEKLLLPAARRARGGVPIDRARDLRIDHAALTSLLVPTPDAPLCGELLSLLSCHDAKEEGPSGVYAECEQLLSEEDSAALAARAESFPAIPVAPHFDGPGVCRTAALALASARRIKWRHEESAP
ncbi:MAG: hemerythrin domain-containing protein [Polyangiaceae bacterium]|nr:hemerythrin domain-containing protein [Polyangiaceae bacterium]